MAGFCSISRLKVQGVMPSVVTSLWAVQVAVRGPPSSSEISPKKSPGPIFLRDLPPTATLTSPSRIRKKPTPESPSRANTAPLRCVTSLDAVAIDLSSLVESSSKIGTPASILTGSCLVTTHSFGRSPLGRTWPGFYPSGSPESGGAAGLSLLPDLLGAQLPDLPVAGASILEELGSDPLALPDQTEEDVLRPDVVVAERNRLAQGQLQHLLGPGGEGDVSRDRGTSTSAQTPPSRTHPTIQSSWPKGLLAKNPQEEMLGPDVTVSQLSGFDLRLDDGLPSPIGESLEHGLPSPSAEPAPRMFLVDSLLADPELSGDLLPRPPEAAGVVHL